MAKRGGGFGVVMLAIVMVVVLLLVARQWREASPQLIEVTHPTAAHAPGVAADSAAALEGLPGLDDVRQGADAHAKDVADAMKQID